MIHPNTTIILVVVFPNQYHRFCHVLEVDSEEVRQGLQGFTLHQVVGIVILNVHYVVLWKEDVIVLLVDCHTWLNHTIRKDALKRLKLQRKEYRR